MPEKRKVVIMLVFVAAVILLPAGAWSGGAGGLTMEEIREIRGSFKLDAGSRALMNAVSNNDLKSLTYNRGLYNSHDEVFTDKIDVKGITDQKSSGRCWIFAAFNTMRPAVIERYKLDGFEFSENYLFFWDKFEKANTFLGIVIETAGRDIDDRELQAVMKDPIPDGGWWNYVVALIDKYGVVPKSVSQETVHTSGTGRMNSLLNMVVRCDAVELRKLAAGGASATDLKSRKMEMLKEIYRVLVLHMGVPAEEFTWRIKDRDGGIVEKSFTPESFYREAVGVDLSEYVTLVDYPALDYEKLYEINYCRGIYEEHDMRFVNLSAGELKKYSLRAIRESEPVWFAADVDKDNDSEKGILAVGMYDYEALFGIDRRLTKAERLQYRDGSPNHAMVFVGADVRDNEPVKWRVENSWGAALGSGGYWTMYDDWFTEYVFAVIVHKKHLPKDVLEVLDTEPARLPAWDPMRAAF